MLSNSVFACVRIIRIIYIRNWAKHSTVCIVIENKFSSKSRRSIQKKTIVKTVFEVFIDPDCIFCPTLRMEFKHYTFAHKLPAYTDFPKFYWQSPNQYFRSKYRLTIPNTHQSSNAKNAGRWQTSAPQR